MGSDVWSAPYSGKSVAAVEYAVRQNPHRAEGVPGERDDIRIIAETAEDAAVLRLYYYIGGVGACAEKLHASAHILLNVAQTVLPHSRFDGLTAVIADEWDILFAEKYLRTCQLPQFCGIEVVVNMGVSEEDVADIELTEPFPKLVTAEIEACINEKTAVFAVYDIAGDR